MIAVLLVSLADPTQLRPERLLAPTEITLDAGLGALFSQATRTPLGAVESQPYEEVTLRLKAGVGITRFLKAELTLPLIDWFRAQSDDLALIRFGDPTIGLTGGGTVDTSEQSQLAITALAELQFPVARQIILRPRQSLLSPQDRGIVVTTGGVTGVLGAMLGWWWHGEGSEVRLSLRGFYRVRSNEASHGAGLDARVRSVLFDRLILGGRIDFLYPFFGLEQAMISPSRLADPAGWLDGTISAGVAIISALDLVAGLSFPFFVKAGPFPITASLLLSYYVIP